MWPFAKARPAPEEQKFRGALLSMGKARFLSHNYRALAQEGYEQNPIVKAWPLGTCCGRLTPR